jgi:dihydroflavonol-4-reductase
MPPMYVDGGVNFVDVRDVAAVHSLVVEKGQPNRRYLATAHNMTQHEFLMAINRALNLDRSYRKLPTPVARRIVDMMEAHAIKTGSEPPLSRSFFEYSLRPSFFSNRRTVEELGATFRPIEDTIRDAVAYFQAVGYLG